MGTASTTGSPAIQPSDWHHEVSAVIDIGVDGGTRRRRFEQVAIVSALRERGIEIDLQGAHIGNGGRLGDGG
jgi:hypothetical protein